MSELLSNEEVIEVIRQASVSISKPDYFDESKVINLIQVLFWECASKMDLTERIQEAAKTYKNATSLKQRYESGNGLYALVDIIKHEIDLNNRPQYNPFMKQFESYLEGQRELWGLP